MNAHDAFTACHAKLVTAEENLAGWHRKLNDPRKFRPIMQIEYGRAFDRREKVKSELCRMDRTRYAALFPNEPNDR